MRHATGYLLAGAVIALLPPMGLVLHRAIRGAADERMIFAWLAIGGVILLGAAGWMIGRREDKLQAQNRRLASLSSELREAAMTDALTELGNRRAFDERLALEVTLATRYGTPLALVMLDLDHFKRVNDRLGHVAGDEVLRRIGALLLRERRAGDLVARYGGEEMVALLPHTNRHAAEVWGNRVREAIAGQRAVTASFGVADLESCPERSGRALVEAADRALLVAKRTGRDRVILADPAPAPRRGAGRRLIGSGPARTAHRWS